ncbi:hypothetical protein [Kitasatospora aureofaciens]|uniref:hypothetical protein n=1 Tax=Kitasatospora aureofaciens TaxID=1894 RepID=UPI000928F140
MAPVDQPPGDPCGSTHLGEGALGSLSSLSSLSSLPEVVLAKHTETGRLAALALQWWNEGDREGTLEAIGQVVPAAEAAAAALNTLVELDEAAACTAAEEERRRRENIAANWWGRAGPVTLGVLRARSRSRRLAAGVSVTHEALSGSV